MKTDELTKRAVMAVQHLGGRLFRNNTATAWVGDVRREGTTVILRNARVLHAGLVVGSSDTIGWRSMTITPDMVGRKVAVFAAIEIKNGKDRLRPEQKQFIDAVKQAGGIAGVAREPEDAAKIFESYPHIAVDTK
jgi:hypothetical protein